MYNLYIEKVLDNWDVEHAVREIIANALDEQKLTNTQEIKIYPLECQSIEKMYNRYFRKTLSFATFLWRR